MAESKNSGFEVNPATQPRGVHTASVDRYFSISSQRLKDGIVVVPAGEIDLATASIVEDELQRAEHSEELVMLDLRDVSFIDSTGLRTVIEADQRLRERGGSLRLIHVPPHVHRLFRLVGIADRLAIDHQPEGGWAAQENGAAP